jgi:hypothetical protein
MALKVDFLQSIYQKLTDAFNASSIVKEGGRVHVGDLFKGSLINYRQESIGRTTILISDAGGGAATAGAYYVLSGSGSGGFGRILKIKTLVFEADLPCTIQFRINMDVNSDTIPATSSAEKDAYTVFTYQQIAAAGRVVVPYDDLNIYEFDTAQVWVNPVGTVKPNIKVTGHVEIFTRDLNFSADKCILGLGDSITNGPLGLNTAGKNFTCDSHFLFLMRDWLNEVTMLEWLIRAEQIQPLPQTPTYYAQDTSMRYRTI